MIYVIRHGEKNAAGNHLSRVGRSRAQYVAQLWGPEGRFAIPKAIFANFYNQEFNSVELVEPLAERLGLPVNSSLNRKHNWHAAGAILSHLDRDALPILVAWEHRHIVRLLVDMGCPCERLAPWWSRGWPKIDFDEVFILFFRSGMCMRVSRTNEGFYKSQRSWWSRWHPYLWVFVLLLSPPIVLCLWCLLRRLPPLKDGKMALGPETCDKEVDSNRSLDSPLLGA